MSRFSHASIHRLISPLAMSVLLYTGCDFVTHPESRRTTLFSSLETRTIEPEVIQDKGPELSAADSKMFNSIIDGFSKNAAERLAEDEVLNHIQRIDQIFFATGRYLDLIKIYEQDYETRGVDSRIAGRLAFAYVKLDQQDAAKPIVDAMLKKNPDDPHAYFVQGLLWVRSERTIENMGKALESLERVLQLAPNYRGFDGISDAQVRQQIDQLRQLVPADWKAQVEAAKKRDADAQKKSEEPVPKPPREPEQPAESAPEVASGKPTPTDAAPPAELKTPTMSEREQQYTLLVAEAAIAVHEGRLLEAEQKFNAAKVLKPEGFSAQFGHLKAGWRAENARNKIAVEIRQLAERPDLTAQQAFDLGAFARDKMSDRTLARTLWERTTKLDPELATRLGVAALLSDL